LPKTTKLIVKKKEKKKKRKKRKENALVIFLITICYNLRAFKCSLGGLANVLPSVNDKALNNNMFVT